VSFQAPAEGLLEPAAGGNHVRLESNGFALRGELGIGPARTADVVHGIGQLRGDRPQERACDAEFVDARPDRGVRRIGPAMSDVGVQFHTGPDECGDGFDQAPARRQRLLPGGPGPLVPAQASPGRQCAQHADDGARRGTGDRRED
jgi:hypothetical protein